MEASPRPDPKPPGNRVATDLLIDAAYAVWHAIGGDTLPLDEQYRLAETIRWHLDQDPPGPSQWVIEAARLIRKGRVT